MAGQGQRSEEGTAGEVFQAFLKLGLTSFGGPVAHIGYFRADIVAKRRWLSEEAFAGYVALAQLLPGPASSQVGLALGLHRAGWLGGLAAFAGFTLPSALLMLLAAILFQSGLAVDGGWLQGLKLVAVVVVAEAVRQMARQLCPEQRHKVLAVLGAVLALSLGGFAGQISAILSGAILGRLLLHRPNESPLREEAGAFAPGAGLSKLLLGSAAALLALSLLASLVALPEILELAAGFYRAGALVFGGGHVVLPLLEEVVVAPGLMDHDSFLAGYGAAQALPGPLFSLSVYLGFLAGGQGVWGALVAILAIFLPGFLLVTALSSRLQSVLTLPGMAGVFAGINAAVVGLLLAALYTPVATSALTGPAEAAIALVGWGLLALGRAPILAIVLLLPALAQIFL
ncbi:MAG: chromate efflux transporter [Limibacillus sp.]